MKRGLALVLAALIAGSGAEAMAAPTPAFPREWATTPTTFVDEILLGIPKGGGLRRGWKRARDQVLSAYAPSGLQTLVQEIAPTPPRDIAAIPSGQIVAQLLRGSGVTSYGTVNDVNAPTAGFVDLRTHVPKNPARRPKAFIGGLKSLLAHELGHVLGLDHTTDRTSVMHENYWGPSLPSQNDIAGLIGPEVGLPDPGDQGYQPPNQARRSRRRG